MGTHKITFRITIISLYFLLSLIMLGIIFLSMIYFDNILVRKSIVKEFGSISRNAQTAISDIDEVNSRILNLVSVYDNANADFYNADKGKLLQIFLKLFQNNPKLYSAYIGYGDGCFYELISLDINQSLRKKYNASPSDRWLVVTVFTDSGRYIKKLELLDEKLNVTSTSSVNSDYDPRTRPWFIKASASDNVIKTDPYTFSNFDGRGITYALKLKSGNVLSVDVLTDSLDTLLNSYKFTGSSSVYLFDKNGGIFAAAAGGTKNDIRMKTELLAAVEKNDSSETLHYIKRIGGQKYFFHLKKLTTPFGGAAHLGFAAPYSDIMRTYTDRSYKILYACLGSLMLMIPLILYLVSLIVRPITLLEHESEKVSKRQFSRISKVKTRLMEIHRLSDSMYVMSKSIQDYQQNLEQKIEERTKELEEKNTQLEKLSVTDRLTEVFNRMKLDSVLEGEINRANRYKNPLSLIILDIDHFKRVNDTHGHQTGDSVLVEFADILRKTVRNTDTVGRWGGEEFLVICPETGLKGAISLAESIREKIEAHNFTTVGRVTASIGVSAYSEGDREKDMIGRADACLYQAKAEGRNRVICT